MLRLIRLAWHRVRVVAIESSIDCSQPRLIHEEREGVADDSRHVGCSSKHTMASERVDVRDLSSSL